MAITLNQLQSFLAVAREGSVSGAAGKLYVTQPSISAAVSALSRELEVDLTERVGRGIGLTAAGEAFRPYASLSPTKTTIISIRMCARKTE